MTASGTELASDPVIVTAHFVVRHGGEDAFRRAGAEVTRATNDEVGCIAYVLHEDPERPRDFCFYETWRSEYDLEVHLRSTHVREFLDAVEPLLEQEIAVRRWHTVAPAPPWASSRATDGRAMT